jgi:4-phytase/acid phosphatase
VELTRIAGCAVLALFALSAAAEDLVLQQVVLVSRHGVRSPTDIKPPLAQLAADPWPNWEVGPGMLTAHGAQAATLMGSYYRAAFASEGLLAPDGCPRKNDLFVWSDVEERTRASAQAMLDGMYPGCGLEPATQPDLEADDPLFHPTTGGVCKLDGPTARTAILGRTGGDLDALLTANAEPFARLQSVLKCCSPTLCKPGRDCTLQQIPTVITSEGRIQGPLPIASALTEVFLLEYVDGLPAEQVAWARADEPALLDLSQLHDLYYDITQRTFYPAQRYGSNLLDQVVSTLRARATGKRAPLAKAPAASKVVMLLGHDTNIANLGGLLNADWLLAGYQRNATPPGGALAFHLYRGKTTGRYFVRLFYYAQSPQQLRELTRLDVSHPPSRAEIALPACVADGAKAAAGMACPWMTFERLATGAIDRACVGAGKPQKASAPKM